MVVELQLFQDLSGLLRASWINLMQHSASETCHDPAIALKL